VQKELLFGAIQPTASQQSNPTARYLICGMDHKDVGANFERAYVLLSDDFQYLGRDGTTASQMSCSALPSMVEDLEIGHRRYHIP
jgi:hypothetical protein